MLFSRKKTPGRLKGIGHREKKAECFYSEAERMFLRSELMSDPLRLRIHRSLSWLVQSEKLAGVSADCCFMTLWVAFNAAYGKDMGPVDCAGDRAGYKEFIGTVCTLDTNGVIGNALFSSFSSSVRVLLENRFCYQPFWNAVNGRVSMKDASARFCVDRHKAYQALEQGDHSRLLGIVADRIYTLRNQILHGGATCESSANRKVVATATEILKKVVPAILIVMMEHPEHVWGAPIYPYLKDGIDKDWKV